MKTIDYGDDRESFLRALAGKSTKPKAKARDARPGIPRAAVAERGSGERIDDLSKLAALGYTLLCYDAAMQAWFVNVKTGARTPTCATYRQALDVALEQTKGA